MGKAKCGTCHFMPLFNGVASPDFTKAEAEILGVPAAKDKAILDTDSENTMCSYAFRRM